MRVKEESKKADLKLNIQKNRDHGHLTPSLYANRREKVPTPLLWPGEFHGLYSPWSGKE